MSEKINLKKRKRGEKKTLEKSMKILRQETANLPSLCDAIPSTSNAKVSTVVVTTELEEIKTGKKIARIGKKIINNSRLIHEDPEEPENNHINNVSMEDSPCSPRMKNCCPNCEKCICRQWTSFGKSRNTIKLKIVYRNLYIIYLYLLFIVTPQYLAMLKLQVQTMEKLISATHPSGIPTDLEVRDNLNLILLINIINLFLIKPERF